ncbi:hypothetical protein GWG65_12120 [Bradyrhizobium sp. CSA207]|nr:hypothetical protein [Bradyrhizobium sp. CSA207]
MRNVRSESWRAGREALSFEGRQADHNRHCEEPLRRSNPGSLRGKILDCFAALAMTRWMEPPKGAKRSNPAGLAAGLLRRLGSLTGW